MRRKIQAIIVLLLILIVSTTLCFGDDGEKKPKTPKEWWDLSEFNTFLDRNYDVTVKKEPGSGAIQSISDPEGALYIAVGLDEPFTELEVEALHHFVDSGGNIIIASDNHTNVNILSEKFDVTFKEQTIIYPLEEIDYNYTFLPVFADTGNKSYLIIVHSPHGLELPEENYRIIAESLSDPKRVLSALDMNNDQGIGPEDIPGPIPIIVEVSFGLGKAVFVSDASLFTNHLWQLESIDEDFPDRVYENDKFTEDLIGKYYTPGKELINDKSKQEAGFSNFHPYPKD